MAREVLSNGVINPDKYQADWYADLSNNWNLLNNLIGSAISGSEVDSKIATAIQELMVRTFQIVAELPETGTEGIMYLVIIPDTSKYTAYVWENSAYRELGVIQMTITIDDELSTTSENPLQNKVTTNALNGKANISHTHSASDITSGLATVATSGSYNDLSNKPTIPTVNDGTLTIQKNGTTAGIFTANQSTNETVNIEVPTATSELTNDSGYLTSSSNLDASKLTSGTVDIARLPQGALERLVKVANESARYALTTSDVQLGDTVQQLDTGIMYVVTDTDHLDSAAGYTEYTAGTAASVPWSGVTGKPAFAAVATSGAYSDLTGTPTIIPLAGSNQISGDLIPSTNNTIDIGSSSKKIKSVFANYLNDINLSTLFDISNVGYVADLNDSTLRVRGKIIVCSYNAYSSNIPTPNASGTCFTLANQDSSSFGVQVTLSNKGIYARFIESGQYKAWGAIIS